MTSEPAVCGQFTIQTHCTAQQLVRHLQLTQQMFDCDCGDLKTGSTKQIWTVAVLSGVKPTTLDTAGQG